MISNATPIIHLSRINQLSLLKKIFKEIIISPSVKQEVLIKDKPGYSTIVRAIKEGWIKIIEPKSKIKFSLGSGENSVINLAIERKDRLLIDDAFAIKVTKAFDIPVIRTTTVLFKALQKKIISKERAIKLLNQLIEDGYYIAPREYSILLTRLTKSKI